MSTSDSLENWTTTDGPVVFNGSKESNSDAWPTISTQVIVFCWFVIAIGLCGTFMNGVVLSVLLSKKLRTKASYLLIINQVVLDFLSCLVLVVCYAVKVGQIHMEGRLGNFLCIVFYGDNSIYSIQAGSIVNLVLVAVERYFKIVHGVHHRTYYRRWMSYAGILFSWVNATLVNIMVTWTGAAVDGVCNIFYYWPSGSSFVAYGGFIMVWEFVVPLVLFVYLYGHILLSVRQRVQAFNDHQAATTTTATTSNLQTKANRSQMNVIITMIIVSLSFVLFWLPNQIFYLLTFVDSAFNIDVIYYATVFLIFLNVCSNPLIYAAKHEEVKNRLRKWFFIAKVRPDTSTGSDATSSAITGTSQLTAESHA